MPLRSASTTRIESISNDCGCQFCLFAVNSEVIEIIIKRDGRGSACTSQLFDLRSENNGVHNLKVIVKLLSISQLFLLCVRASASSRCVASLVDAFSLSRSVSQRPKFFSASSGLVVGLQGLYWGAVLSATGEPHGAYDRSGRMFVGY